MIDLNMHYVNAAIVGVSKNDPSLTWLVFKDEERNGVTMFMSLEEMKAMSRDIDKQVRAIEQNLRDEYAAKLQGYEEETTDV